MLSIVMGRACTGKSRHVLTQIVQKRAQRPQLLLVPEHTSHEAEVDVCRACGATASRDTEVLSFRSLSGRILAEVGGAQEFTLDNGGKILTLRRCLQELAPQLKVFGKPSQRVSFLQQMTALFDEFYAYRVTAQSLLREVETLSGSEGDKLRDVALLFGAYDAKLHSDTFDARSRMQKLCDALPQTHYFDGKDVYFDGFSFFNRLEEDVVAFALRHAESVTVTLLGDHRSASLFTNAAAARERLVRLCAEAGVRCEIHHTTARRPDALGHLERCFFGTDEIYRGDCAAITVYEMTTALREVEYVSSQIRALAQRGCRYRDIAVAARNMEQYAPLLERVFHRDGIPAYISRRSDILDKPVLTLLLGAVDAVTGGFEYEDMFRYLKTGLAGITAAECDLLENYVIRWQIRGDLWLRDAPWTANPDGYGVELNDARREKLAQVNAVCAKVAMPLRPLVEGLRGASTAEDKAKTLYLFAQASGVPAALQEKADALLQSGQVQLSEEYRQLWDIVIQVLDQFVEILGDTTLDGEEFARLLRLVLTQYSVGTIPATLDQVKVSEITRNDRHGVEVLFLLGATDDALPTVSRERGILDGDDRALLQRHDIMLSDATFDALDNELQNIYACLAQPTGALHVSYPTVGSDGAEQRRSFVVERILQLFPTVGVQRDDGKSRLTLPAAALEAAGECGGALWDFFARDETYRETLHAMLRAREMQRGTLSPAAVQALYGKTLSMTASRMDKANSCHFAYFMEYGLRARERKSAGFEAPEIGTFLHYLLENISRDVQGCGGYRSVSDEQLHGMIRRYCEAYARTELGSLEGKSARFRYLFERLCRTAYEIVDNVAEELRQSDFKPIAFELGFGGADGVLPAVTVEQGDTHLRVNGKVDRVDGWEHNGKLYLRVVDYKTGKKEFKLADVRCGLNVQMLLYLFALEDVGAQYFHKPIVPAGVLYHPARDVILRRNSDLSDAQLQKELQKERRRSGLLLCDPTVLQAMEHGAPEETCYLPVKAEKDGSIGGYVATAAQLGKLSRYVEGLLHQIAGEIGGGIIAADPCSHGTESSCDYCPYLAACGFDERHDRRRYVTATDPEEFWAYIDEKTDKEARHG